MSKRNSLHGYFKQTKNVTFFSFTKSNRRAEHVLWVGRGVGGRWYQWAEGGYGEMV
jgi:hypothetical protein